MDKKTRNQILTIPNLLSLFQIVLIPFIVWAYFNVESNVLVVSLILVSGLTDVIDGFIARKFNMISDAGKIIDPIADKLTQGTLIICLVLRYQMMFYLIIFFIMKEITMGIFGLITIKKIGEVNSAKWYGKVNTVLLYGIMTTLILFPQIDVFIANFLIGLCIIFGAFTLIMYILFFVKLWKNKPASKDF